MNQELTGRFITERHRFENLAGDVVIADIHAKDTGKISVKGHADFGELVPGLDYRFFGRFTNYTNKRTKKQEKQFSFKSFVALEPVSREAVIGYLCQHGAGLGLGKRRATVLWEQLGEQAVEMCRTDPKRVCEILKANGLFYRIGNATHLAEALKNDFATEAIKLDLVTLLDGRGFPKALTKTLIQEFGNKAAVIVRRDPYRLLKFAGCGFKRCDSMYLDLGHPPGRLKRQALCAWFSINRDTEGHTWFSRRVPEAFLRSNISGADYKLDKSLELAERGKLLSKIHEDNESISQDGGLEWFAEKSKADNETVIAKGVIRGLKEPHFWPCIDSLNLSDHQKQIASKALTSSIAILGGGPGTGKTWTVAELVSAIAEKIGLDNVCVGAPTGKAAVRVTENLQAKGIDLRARTWHSLLMQLETQKKLHFSQKVLIGDEWSMCDTDLTAAILRSRAAGSMLLMVGDVNQLPPVGHGAPLRDLIAASVPYGELTEIVRNSGGIVEACAAMREQRPWQCGDNLSLVDTDNNHLNRIEQIIQMALTDGLDPVWDLQIVTAVNEKSILSRKELNKVLQQILNTQPGEVVHGFRVGDKVVNTKNGFFKSLDCVDDSESNERDEVYVANGELGKVIDTETKSIIIALDSPKRKVQAFFGQDGGCTWELGYALSVHKSQGSDWPWVCVVLDEYPGAKMACDRSWLYTAISRAKDRCFLVGKKSVADRMCRVSKIWHRKTFLKEKLLAGISKDVLANV